MEIDIPSVDGDCINNTMNIYELESFNLSDGLSFNDELNQKLWDKRENLHPEIHDQLMAIAADFGEFLGVKDLNLTDITISGSNAAFSYTPHSDIDLHLIVDLSDVEHEDVYRELFSAKKSIYNKENTITIKGIPVEVYVQDATEEHHSQGIYSILNSSWIQIPRRVHADIDDVSVRSKYQDLSKRIKNVIKTDDLAQMNELMDKIRQMRSTGLSEKGEFGPENLAFKILRNKGDIKKLNTARQAAKDQELSLKERVRTSAKYGYGKDYIEEVGLTPDGTNPTTSEFTNESQLDEVGLTPDGTNPTTAQFTNETKGDHKSTIKNFMEFCADQLGIDKDISLRIRRDPQWSVRNKTFGRYNDGTKELEVGIGGRHIMDVLRTVAHELVHQKQNQDNTVPADAGEDGSEYENEANAQAGVLMRQYGKLHPELFAVGTNLDEYLGRIGSYGSSAGGMGTTGSYGSSAGGMGTTGSYGPTAEGITETEQSGGTRLKDLATVATNMPDADFWLIRKGSDKTVGTPVKEFEPSRIGVKIVRTDVLDPNYLYYAMMNLHNQGYFARLAVGTLKLVNIKVSDVANISFGGQGVSESSLNETQTLSTDEFKRWFAGSKVVDATGKPIVLYHGTNQNIAIFKLSKEGALGKGIYMTPDPAFASEYAMTSAFDVKHKSGNNVLPLYAKIVNPVEITYVYGRDMAGLALRALGVSPEKASDMVEKAYEVKGNLTNEIFSRAVKLGHDGILYYDEDGTIREAVAFSSNQIKSVFNQKPSDSNNISTESQLSEFVDESAEDDNSDTERRDKLKSLLRAGKDRGYIFQKEITTAFPEITTDDIASLSDQFEKMGIVVYTHEPDDNDSKPEPTQTKISGSISTSTPEFKKWFSGSKVVDTDGNPLRVYHAAAKGFEGSEFKPPKVMANNGGNNPSGYYFSPSLDDANRYVKHHENTSSEYETGAQIIPAYLSIKNPYIRGVSIMSAPMSRQYYKELIAANQHMSDEKLKYYADSKVKSAKGTQFPKSDYVGNNPDALKRIIEAGGFDGILDGPHWVAFYSNQIKSVYNQKPSNSNNISTEGLNESADYIPQNILDLHQKHERITAMANERIPSEPNAQGVYPRPQDLKREQTMSFRRLFNAVEKFTGDTSGDPSGPTMKMLTRLSELSRAENEKDMAEGIGKHSKNTYLWHGSRHKNEVLIPRQATDTGGAAGSNQNAIYATTDPKIAIAMGLTTSGSDTGMFPNDPQMVLFSGKIRKGEYVYLHKLPMNGPDGKPQFVQGGNSREFHSIPIVKSIKPTEIKEIPVNKYLNLIRKATPADLKLRKKYMKQSVSESSGYIPTAAEADDPRFEMALTVDVRPGALGKAANSFLLNTDSQGHPQELRPDGLVQRMTEELALFKKKPTMKIHELIFESKKTYTLGGFAVKPIHIEDQDVDEAIKIDAPQKPWAKQDMQDYLNRIKTDTKTKRDRFNPIIHGSNIKAIVKADGTSEWDLDDLKSQITTPPQSLFGKNAKMIKGEKEGTITYDLTLPALSGMVVDEETGEFVEITTCPGAEECQHYCYARKGGYVMFPDSSMSAARSLNFLVNHPKEYMAMFDSEVKQAKIRAKKNNVKLEVRIHDAGDYFSKEYWNLSKQVQNANPDANFYFYSKNGDIITDPDKPTNTLANFSANGAQKREINKVDTYKSAGNNVKGTLVIPKDMFRDLFVTDAKGKYIKDEAGRTQVKSNKAWTQFKQQLASKYNVDPKSIITYDQMVKKKEPRPVGKKDKLMSDGTVKKVPVYAPAKWNVVVFPAGGVRISK